MELRHLHYFQAVAETLSFSHAAERLRVSQSSISRQVAALEQELGTRLFVRNTTRVSLTDAGAHLHKELDRLLAQLAIALTATQEIARGRSGELKIGSDWRVLCPQIPEAILRYRASHPRVVVDLVEVPLHAQIEALREGRIHVAFVPDLLVPRDSELESLLLFKADIKIVVPPRHCFAASGSIAMRELRQETWIRLDEKTNPGYRALMIQLCHPALFTPRFGATAESIEGMLARVALGEGICLLPTSLISRPRSDLRFLDSDCLPSEFHAIWRKAGASGLADGFVSILRQTLTP